MTTALLQEPYDPEEFVERLAWRAATASAPTQASSNPFESAAAAAGANPFFDEVDEEGDSFDAQQLNDAFVQSIKDLSIMLEKQHKKCQSLEQVIQQSCRRVIWPIN